MMKQILRDGRKTIIWVGCACIGAYVVYRYWKKRELKSIDEGFEEASKAEDNPEKRVLLLGLDGAGKTSLMNQICTINNSDLSYTVPPQPTLGSLVYRLKNGLYSYNIWDIGGAADTRIYWSTFLQDTDLLVFMVDASDTDRLSLAASILKELLGDPRMETVPILIIASKQDCPNALKPEQIKEALDLLSISPHKHKVEVVGCQTRPLPDLPSGQTRYTWSHTSVGVIRKKIFSMATL